MIKKISDKVLKLAGSLSKLFVRSCKLDVDTKVYIK